MQTKYKVAYLKAHHSLYVRNHLRTRESAASVARIMAQADSSPPRAGEFEPGAGAPGAQLVVKALNMLDLIGQAPGRHRAQTLARELGLPRSTVYRILTVLQQRQMVRIDQGGAGYHPGFRFLDYAQGVWPLGGLPLLALAELRALAELTGETAYFAVRAGDEMIVIQRIDSAFPQRANVAPGERMSLLASAAGRAFLANLVVDDRDRAIARAPVDRAHYVAQLDLIRLRRYAADDDESDAGFRSVGAAAMGDDGAPLGAFVVAGPAFRMTRERAHQWGAEVAAAAARLGEALRRRGQRVRGSDVVAPLGDYRAAQAKAPIWDKATKQLIWLDALAPAAMTLDADGEIRQLADFDAPAAAMAPLADDLIVATAHGALTLTLTRDGERGACDLIPADLAARTSAMCAAGDDLWLAIAASSGAARRGLYRVNRDGAELMHEFDVAISTMIATPDRAALLIASIDGGEIIRASLSHGRVASIEPIMRIDPIRGRPSALAFDSDGGLWAALWDGWAIARLTPERNELRLLSLPTPRPTGLAFGGEKNDALYVVSDRHSLSPQQIIDAPESGGLFVISREQRDRLLR